MDTRSLLVSVLMLVSVLLSACAPAATPSPAPTAITPTAVPPTAVPSNLTAFQSSIFDVPVSFTYGPGCVVNERAKNAIDIIKGNQWGAGIVLVNGALVHDPATAVSKQSASADKADFVPWPDDFLPTLPQFQM